MDAVNAAVMDTVKESSAYAKGCPSCFDKEWYHGELSRVEAEQALTASGCDCFLVRVSEGALILSLIHHGQLHHINISYSPEGYRLQHLSQAAFKDLEELVNFYQNQEICGNMKLGKICEVSNYSRGLPSYSQREWYHGELGMVEAEEVLAASRSDCFLVRASRGSLVLSRAHDGVFSHHKVAYSPSGYRLPEVTHEEFWELEDLVAYFSEAKTIDDESKITLGRACKRLATRISSDLIHGGSRPLSMCSWYHGQMSQEQADWVLGISTHNNFLVRLQDPFLVLSMKISGWIYHDVILYAEGRFYLEGGAISFRSVPEMIAHYLVFPIKKMQTLGRPCSKKSSKGPLEMTILTPHIVKGASPFRMTWRRCADLPEAMSAPQVVQVGDTIYAGGGYREPGATKAIFQYSSLTDTWRPLPPCPTHQHGLTKYKGELIAIGGVLKRKVTNIVLTFGEDEQWREELPAMPTSRSLLSALSPNDDLVIAAGGVTGTEYNGACMQTNVVEIMVEEVWYRTTCLPFPTYTLSTSTLGDCVYALGGVGSPSESRSPIFARLSSLLDNAETAGQNHTTSYRSRKTWQVLKGKHPLASSSLAEVDGKLMTFGGEAWHQRTNHGTTIVANYNFDTDTWVECRGAVLPEPIYRPGVVKLGSDEVMIIGGESKMQKFTSKVYITEPVGVFEVYNRWQEPQYSTIF